MICRHPCYILQTETKTKITSITVQLLLYLFLSHLPTNRGMYNTKFDATHVQSELKMLLNVDIFATLTQDIFWTRVGIENLSTRFNSVTLIMPQTNSEATMQKSNA